MNESSGRIVIVAYRPKPGRDAELLALTREHVRILRAEGLATQREPVICQALDGTVVEVFEWEAVGMEQAHSNPKVHELWARFAEVCDYVPLSSLAETENLFADFQPLS